MDNLWWGGWKFHYNGWKIENESALGRDLSVYWKKTNENNCLLPEK